MHYPDQLQGRKIRLLSIELDTYRAPIRCHLIEASLDDLPEYEALSYVWGDSTCTEQIMCNGQIHHVTTNAARAIRRIRLGISSPNPKKDTTDPGAKYQKPTDSEENDDIKRPASSHFTSVSSSPKRYRPKFLWIDALCIDQTNDSERSHQVQLMRDIYSKAGRVIVWLGDTKASFKRMAALSAIIELVAQNFTSNRQLRPLTMSEVQSRLSYMTWEDIWGNISAAFLSEWYTRVWCVQEVVLAQDSTVLYRNAEVACEDMAKLCKWLKHHVHHKWRPKSGVRNDHIAFSNTYSASRRFDHKVLYGERSTNPASILFSSRKLKAKDPRDRFYGLLGLFKEVIIDIDYSKSVSEVYRDSVLQTTASSLRVLSCVYHGYTYHRKENWPSWIPDWQSGEWRNPLDTRRIKGSGASRRRVGSCDAELARAGCLQLRGIMCDRIVATTRYLRKSDNLEGPSFAQLHEDFLDLWGKSLHAPHLSTLLPWARIFTGGYMHDTRLSLATKAEQEEQFVSDFTAFIRGSRDEGALGCRKKTNDAMARRRAFLTGKVWLGIGPMCMRPGDVVVVFHGGFSPYALRPVQDRPDHYYLMGECYIHELANEGAYKMLQEGTAEEKVFNLI